MQKLSLPKGMRDFSPAEMLERKYIFNSLEQVFQKYGYQCLQTPSLENLATLNGKYGDEGDRLIFKVLNSGNYLAEVPKEQLLSQNPQALTPLISEKALRYDLTVPFARYVAMHQNDLVFPFKRYQIQPVWRADRPQKGRYREFYQCDADVVGGVSLLYEAELLAIYQESFAKLGLKIIIQINHRALLTALAESTSQPEKIIELTVALDKLDKIKWEGVEKELLSKGFTHEDTHKLQIFTEIPGDFKAKLLALKQAFSHSEIGLKGISELETIFDYANSLGVKPDNLELNLSLARGLNYYTGAIFEVKVKETAELKALKFNIGSIGGGGRYDDLTAQFSSKNLTGVGISFGADRIYDTMQALKLFPKDQITSTKVLFLPFDTACEKASLLWLTKLRKQNIAADIYPAGQILKKGLAYAHKKGIPYVLIIGEKEIQNEFLSLKNMTSGEQLTLSFEEVLSYLIAGKSSKLNPCNFLGLVILKASKYFLLCWKKVCYRKNASC